MHMRILFLVAVLGAYSWYSQKGTWALHEGQGGSWQTTLSELPAEQEEDDGNIEPSAPRPQVTLLLTAWCPYCQKQEEGLKKNGILYRKLDVEKTAAGRKIYQQLGGGGIPITIVGKEVIRGYDLESVIRILERETGKPLPS